MAEEYIKKPKLEDDDKAEIGQRLGMIAARYPTSRKLREAGVEITITVFVAKTKNSTTGTLADVTGNVEGIDFTMNRVVVDGKKYKLGEIVKVELPDGFGADADDESNYDSDYGSDYNSDYADHDTHSSRQLSPREIAERQRQMEKYQEQQRRDFERQMRLEQERNQRRWNLIESERNRRAWGEDHGSQHGSSRDYSDYADEPFRDYPDEQFRDYPDEPYSDYTDYPSRDYGDYIPDDSAYLDALAHSENDRNEYADAEARSSSKKEKKDNWRLAYLPQRKKKEKPATSKRNKGKVS